MTNYLENDIFKINEMLKNKEITVTDLITESLEKLEKNKHLNAFITVCKESALEEAKRLDNLEVDNILFGLPLIVKDAIVTKNIKTTAASKILENYIPPYDAHVIELLKKKNMIIVGKSNLDEFAMGSTGQTSYFGSTLNPIDNTKVPGGSSSGSAAAVKALVSPFSLGTDTGGSVRQPSAFCGTVGMKPTYGSVSRYGLIAHASSLDQIGPITNNVYNNALLMSAITDKDLKDYTNVTRENDYLSLLNKDIKALKVAVIKEYLDDLISEDIRNQVDKVISNLKENGVTVEIVNIKNLKYTVLLYQIISMSEASSNLARYDGVRYGYSDNEAQGLEESYLLTRQKGFGDEVKRRIMIGTYLLSGENKNIYYNKALRLRKSMTLEFSRLFQKYNLVIGPTTTTTAYKLEGEKQDELKSFYDDILTIPANLTGMPALSLPIGQNKEGLPIGLQIMADKYQEKYIYQLASHLEKEVKEGRIL